MRKMPSLISVIMPVYNAERYLSQSIDSVLNQTYQNWELILIDDGSSDSSGSLCDEYQKSDKRIKVIHKNNGGVSSARNRGINEAKGDLLTFIDSDDIILTTYLEELEKKSEVDLTICGFSIMNGESFIPELKDFMLSKNPLSLNEIINNPYYCDTPWCKLFKVTIIKENNIRFDEKIKLAEDTLFCYDYLLHCRSVAIIPRSLYIYTGKWGGTGKYQLTFEENRYTTFTLTRVLRKIGERNNIDFSKKVKGNHLWKVEGLFEKYTDKEVYSQLIERLYDKTIEEFLGNQNISPLTPGFYTAIRLFEVACIDKLLTHMEHLRHFITVPINSIPFTSRVQSIFYSILMRGGNKYALMFVKLYHLISKAVKK